ncbi:MAG: UPF0158 family protein [Melioribacteraceae bacterium]|nr:UPF0158 family protein [Melioribacteraceae bacterium]
MNSNKIEITEKQIESIAGELECGMNIYLHKKTLEIISILNFDTHYDADTELWEEDIKKVEENYDMYIKFENMDSKDSFQIMEDFTKNVEDVELKKRLELGLSLSKPFRNFKDIIDCEDEYRNKWFKFKNEKYIEFVKNELSYFNNADE